MSGVLQESDWLVNSYCLAAIVIGSYDVLLTFSREVDCIWRRKFSAVTVLYVVNRYCRISVNILYLSSPLFVHGCKAISIAQEVLIVFASFGIALFTTLRAWAICGSGRSSTILVFLVFLSSMFPVCANIYNFSRPAIFYVDESGLCNSASKVPPPGPIGLFPIFTRSMAVTSDLLLLIITWMKTADIVRVQAKSFRPKLTMLLVRDGTLYFTALFLLNLVTVIQDVLVRYSSNSSTDFILVNEAVAAVLIARFILDLRSFDQSDKTYHMSMSTMQFSSSFAGNIASPLAAAESTWMTGPIGDLEDDERHRHTMELTDAFDVGIAAFNERNRSSLACSPRAQINS